jgi:hypothetical protein
MNKLNRLLVVALLGAMAAGVSAQPGPEKVGFREVKREARMQQQAEREQRREQRALPPVLNQPVQPMPQPVRPPLITPQPGPIAPANAQGGPRRLTPEERQQLRDQIRDARRMYQQGQ